MQILFVIIAALILIPTNTIANTCSTPLDTYDSYNDIVSNGVKNNIPSEYYVLSYSWSPTHCANTDAGDKLPGKKDYLQCGSARNFHYILHGLWPQGRKDKKGGYPRACEGDQAKISRKILEKYLCMTPSVWLLQHEFEYHGTCMHDEMLETPTNYFEKALELHSRLKLPKEKLPNIDKSYHWFVENNSHLTRASIQYYSGGEEWQICYDNQFNIMDCPSHESPDQTVEEECLVKGNISKNAGTKYYFTSAHPDYRKVIINEAKGEKCFKTEKQARKAGWSKAP